MKNKDESGNEEMTHSYRGGAKRERRRNAVMKLKEKLFVMQWKSATFPSRWAYLLREMII